MHGRAVVGPSSLLAEKTGLSGGLGDEVIKELALTNRWVQCKWTIYVIFKAEIAAV